MVVYHYILMDSFPMLLRLLKTTIKSKVDTKSKIGNPRFVDEETIPLVQDEDYDN